MLRRGATEATVEEVRRRQWKRVGVLGFGDPMIYTEPLGRLGIACATADAGGVPPSTGPSSGGWKAATTLNRGVVLGCSEIPLLLREVAAAADLINPVQLLAEAAVR